MSSCWLDQPLKLYDRLPRQPGRAASRTELVEWITERQEADGGWGGIQPPWVYSLIALNLEGMSVDHPVMRRGLDGFRSFSIDDERRLASPGMHVARLGHGVGDARAAQGRSRRASIRRCDAPSTGCSASRSRGGGDWQVKVPMRGCGGWAFEFDNDIYPDVDDTAVVVLALLECAEPETVSSPSTDAVRWCRAMRSRNGAWAAFDKDNTRALVYKLPFADFGAMLDPPSEDVTAHVIEMLAAVGVRH